MANEAHVHHPDDTPADACWIQSQMLVLGHLFDGIQSAHGNQAVDLLRRMMPPEMLADREQQYGAALVTVLNWAMRNPMTVELLLLGYYPDAKTRNDEADGIQEHYTEDMNAMREHQRTEHGIHR